MGFESKKLQLKFIRILNLETVFIDTQLRL